MGRERTGAGKLFYFCFAVLIWGGLAGCSGTPKESSGVSRQEIGLVEPASRGKTTPKPEAVPEKIAKREEPAKPEKEKVPQTRKPLDRGDTTSSLKEDLRTLSSAGKNPSNDQTLFHLGLICADTENPQRDISKALQYFKKILKKYPQSPRAAEARVWIGILEENEKLNRVIEESKKVDMDVEEKKREKAR